MAKKLSPSRKSASKLIFETFKILKEAGGEMRGRDVVDILRERLTFTEWEQERYEKTGYIRWESLLHFFTIDCIKAGYLQKNKGVWILTEEGEEAMKLGPEELLESATQKYREWKAQTDKDNMTSDVGDAEDQDQKQKALLSQFEEKAMEGILDYVKAKNPYEFQDMVAALLRAMGYYVPHVAKRGKDGGVDIIAYTDPLGMRDPRIKVQVKHKPDAAVPVDDIRQLTGILGKPGDVGLFVTSGRFSSEAERSSRESHKHIELVDFERFITLWQEHYPKMSDEDKNMLPMYPIYFLGVNE